MLNLLVQWIAKANTWVVSLSYFFMFCEQTDKDLSPMFLKIRLIDKEQTLVEGVLEDREGLSKKRKFMDMDSSVVIVGAGGGGRREHTRN